MQDPIGNSIEFEYDFYGDLVSVTDQENNITRFTYNSVHGLVDIIDPRGVGVARNIYDNNGRLTAIEDADGNPLERIEVRSFKVASGRLKERTESVVLSSTTINATERVYLFFEVMN